MILRPVNPVSPLGHSGDKPPGGVYEQTKAGASQFLRNHRINNVLLDGVAQFLVADGLIMLRRQHDTLDRNWLSVSVEEGNLRLCIRPQPWQLSTTPYFGLSAH